MKYTILLLFGLLPLMLSSQTYEITGSVKDTGGEALPFANVLLLRTQDSTQVKGTSADENGRFRLPGVAPNLYYLKATYFGQGSIMVPLEVRRDIQIGALVLELSSSELDEVVVTGQRPTIERLPDRVVFKVDNTIASEGTTWDVLRNAPGVVVVQDNLEIRGQRATIYLNDRRIRLTQEEVLEYLRGMPGDMISSVEVIPVPPANFEAESGAILNIKTKQNIVPGYKGSVRGQYTQAVFPKYSIGTSHYYKSENFGIFFNYTANPRKEFKNTESGINWFNPEGEVYAVWDTDLDKITRSQAQQANLVLDFSPTDRDQFNLTSNLGYSPNKQSSYDLGTIMRNNLGQVDSTLRTNSLLVDDTFNMSFDLNYERDLRKEGATLKANAHFTFNELSRVQDGNTDYFDPSGAFIRNFPFATDAYQKIDILTGQADYYTPIPSGSLEAGVKGSFITTDSRIDYFDVDETPPFDIALSDRFLYDEAVYAGYLTFNKNWDPWTLKAGLRAEQTEVKARSVSLDEINRQSYLEWFPSIYVSRKTGKDNSFSFAYSRQLNRPNYADLNPFRFFLNENDFDEGNPNLVPNFSNEFNLNYTIKNTYFIDLYYRDNGRYISTLSFQDNENQTLIQVKQNVLESTSFGLDFTLSMSVLPFWDIYFYNSVFYEDETFLAEQSEIETFKNVVTGYYGYLSNSFTLSKDGTLTGETSLLYLSGFLNGSYVMSETITWNVGLRKTLWEGRGVLTLTAEDLLGRANAVYTTRYDNQDNFFFAVPETQFVRLGFTYNFGNFRLSNRSSQLRKSELQRMENE